jgi:hypothetical protein
MIKAVGILRLLFLYKGTNSIKSKTIYALNALTAAIKSGKTFDKSPTIP